MAALKRRQGGAGSVLAKSAKARPARSPMPALTLNLKVCSIGLHRKLPNSVTPFAKSAFLRMEHPRRASQLVLLDPLFPSPPLAPST